MSAETISTILKKVNKIERNLQELRIGLLADFPKKKIEYGPYKENNILKEVRKVRKKLWNEKYSKTI